MKISKAGLDFIKGFESFVPYVYDDKRPAIKGVYREWKGEKVKGTLTIGYGHTNAAAHPLKIGLGMRITEAQAVEILDVDLDECEEDVKTLCKQPLTQGQFDACTSLLFNMGAGNFKKSTLLKRLNRGDYKGARDAFDLYVNSGGEYMRGLQRRRDGEQLLWDSHYTDALTPDVVAPEIIIEHPAEVDNSKPPMGAGTGSVMGGVAATAATTAVTAAVQSVPVTYLPPPPLPVTDAVSNVSLWQGLGQTVHSFGTFAWEQPYLVAGIVGVALALIYGPKLLNRMGWA